jgi:sugar lactone lactonase YvrE
MKKTISIIFLSLIANLYSYAQIITTIAGKGTQGYSGDGGSATNAEFNGLRGIAIDQSRNVYISDAVNNRIRKINLSGIITNVAGNGSSVFSGDGGQATSAGLGYPAGIAVDKYNNIYIGETNNNRVRKISPTGIITTIAGNGFGAPGPGAYSGDGGVATAAKLNGPNGIAVDTMGNVYFIDVENFRIRKITPTGIIYTIAGDGTMGYSGDNGPATIAKIHPNGELFVDKNRNVIFSDNGNSRIRKVDTMGLITTIAGTGIGGYSGDNGPATLANIGQPLGIDVNKYGDIYFCDGSQNHIRKINTAGIITTVAGNGTAGFSGDGGPGILAALKNAYGLAVDTNGIVYFADRGNNRVRRLSSTVFVGPVNIVQQNINLYPNPATNYITIDNPDKACNSYAIYNLFGQKVLSGSLGMGEQDIAVRDLANGTYCVSFFNESGSFQNMFFIKQ